MKYYLKFLGFIGSSILLVIAVMFVTMSIYTMLFGGYPYPILQFSIIIILIWFFIISIGIYKTKKYLTLRYSRAIDVAIFICGISGILSFSSLQLEQKANFLRDTRARAILPSNNIHYIIEQYKITNSYDGNIAGTRRYKIDSLNHHKILNSLKIIAKTDSLEVMKTYMSQLKQLNSTSNFINSNELYDINNYVQAKTNYFNAKSDYENEKNNTSERNVYSYLFFLSAIIMGVMKISL